jgi:phosphate transport system permease protein
MIKFRENAMKTVFLLTACTSILAVALICIFLFANGVPAMAKIGVTDFLFGLKWKPLENLFGILPMIIGSIYVTAGAVLFGVPIGILCAVFMARFCPKGPYKIIKPAIELMAGIPSIVYGFFGLVVVVPAVQELFGGSGKGIFTASLLLGLMILPTVIGVAESAIRAVPENYYEGALALGATHEQSVFTAVVPAAGSGIMAGVILGIGRAIGETMAVVMVAGNQAVIPEGILSGVRTMTANIVLEMGYAADLHRDALIATAVVLFVFILIINLSFSLVKRRES